MKKYELVASTTSKFFQIKALKDFCLIDRDYIEKGELGGFVSSEHNLSQEGQCWIKKGSHVLGDSVVSENAVISGNSFLSGDVYVNDRANIHNCVLDSSASISGNSMLMNSNFIRAKTLIVNGHAIINHFNISGDCVVAGHTKMEDLYFITNIVASSPYDLCSIKPVSTFTNELTAYRSFSGKIIISSRDFYGPFQEYRNKILQSFKHKSAYRTRYLEAYRFLKKND